jgi:hypothetical protein
MHENKIRPEENVSDPGAPARMRKRTKGNQAAEKGTSAIQESDGRQNPLRPKQIDEKSWAAPCSSNCGPSTGTTDGQNGSDP